MGNGMEMEMEMEMEMDYIYTVGFFFVFRLLHIYGVMCGTFNPVIVRTDEDAAFVEEIYLCVIIQQYELNLDA